MLPPPVCVFRDRVQYMQVTRKVFMGPTWGGWKEPQFETVASDDKNGPCKQPCLGKVKPSPNRPWRPIRL
jgi:hypothetical protein